MPKPLTAAQVRSAKPGRHHDGGGLYLNVKPTGAKSWVFRGTINGRRTNRGIGPVALVSLAEARIKALEIRRAIFDGNDPFPARSAAPTFAKAAESVIAINRPAWRNARTEEDWRSTLGSYAMPTLGARRVDAISTADVLAVVQPIWAVKHKRARDLRQRINAIMQWSIAQGYRSDNPAGEALTAVLPRVDKEDRHHAALPYAEVGPALAKIRDCDAPATAKLAFEFLALTAVRSGEVREAVWDEIDTETRTWTIPASRMKANREHRVPLSNRAMEVLSEARAHGESGLVFPGARAGRPVAPRAFRSLMGAQGLAGTPHGLRSSFRDWCAEQTDTPEAVAEAALAHGKRSAVEAAYHRTDQFDRRRVLMDQWAAYLAG